jgi:cytochrome c551
MRGLWRPLVVGAAIVVGVFALAQAHIFEPSAAPPAGSATGDATRGAVLYEERCASCHGPAGEGGSGPRLAGTGLDSDSVAEQIRQGGGIMPAGLVTGQDEADVAAYVESISRN